MKIFINQVPAEGLLLEEEIKPAELELETELIKFRSNLKIKAHVSRVISGLIVDLNMRSILSAACSRCLEEFEWQFNKDVQLSYPIDSSASFIDLSPEIREEIIFFKTPSIKAVRTLFTLHYRLKGIKKPTMIFGQWGLRFIQTLLGLKL